MKTIQTITTLFILISLFGTQLNAQKFTCEGSLQIKVSDATYCNIIMMSNVAGEKTPIAILEGMEEGKPFSVKCTIQEVESRGAVVFFKAKGANDPQFYNQSSTEPMLILLTGKKSKDNKIVWGHLNFVGTEGYDAIKNLSPQKINIPNYRAYYAFSTNPEQNKALMAVSVEEL